MGLFPGVYLRARRGLLALGRHDWLRGRGLREVELESTDFNDAYELLVSEEQDDGRLRELFDPKTIVWLAEHPLRPHFEFRAGFLVVYVPGYLEDLGRVVWLLEAAERIAGRVQTEITEARRVGSRPCASASSSCSSPRSDCSSPPGRRVSPRRRPRSTAASRTRRSPTAARSASSTRPAAAGGAPGSTTTASSSTVLCFCARAARSSCSCATTARSTRRRRCATSPPSAACTARSSARSTARCPSLSVRYDRRGVPRGIGIDNIKLAIDDEVTYRVDQFWRGTKGRGGPDAPVPPLADARLRLMMPGVLTFDVSSSRSARPPRPRSSTS